MPETWLTTRDTAELLKISVQAVKKSCKSRKYKVRHTKLPSGQKGYLIARSSIKPGLDKPLSPSPQSSAGEPQKLHLCNERQRTEAFRRLEILQKWEQFAFESGLGIEGCLPGFIASIGGGLTARTLYKWKAAYREENIMGLIPRWRNAQARFSDDTFCPEARLLAKQLWLHPSRPSYKIAYRMILKEGAGKGWAVPSYTTVKRFLQAIPYAAQVMMREGKKAFEDKAVPAIMRNDKNLKPLEIAESDHHQLDIATVDHHGNVFFPWLTMWYDVASRRPLGWGLFTRPNSDGISITLQRTILDFGLPANAHIDNGKDYRSKIFRGDHPRFRTDETVIQSDIKPSLIEGIYGSLGINVHWAKPYNAKSKVIERFFQTLRTEFSVWFRGYRGKNIQERPEKLAKEMRRRDLVPFDELKRHLENWIENEYCQNRPHRSLENRTPNQVFATLQERRTVDERELTLLCSQYPRDLKVGNNGIYFLGDYYWSEDLIGHTGERVKIRYAEDEPEKIYVMDQAGEFVCSAMRRNPGTWEMNSADYRAFMRQKQAVKEAAMPHISDAKELSDEQRERLFLSTLPGRDAGIPQLKGKQVKTPWAVVLADEEKRKKDHAAATDRMEEYLSMYDGRYMLKEEKEDDEDEIDRYLKKYYS